MPNSNVKSRTLKLAKMALMTAVAVICSLVHFPILPAAPFLEFEVSDIPILIAGFVFGPLPGLIIGVVAILLHDLMLGPSSGPYGMIMHIIAAGVFVFVSAAIYQKLKSREWKLFSLKIGSLCMLQGQFYPPISGLFSLIIGGLCMTAAMIPANLIVTPLFMGVPLAAVQQMLIPVILPFNLLKMAINTAVVFLLYKRLSPFLHKW